MPGVSWAFGRTFRTVVAGAVGAITLLASALIADAAPPGTVLWANTYNTQAHFFQHGNQVDADADGNMIVGGTFRGTLDLGGDPLTAQGDDVFVAGLNVVGDHQWSTRFGTTGQQLLTNAVALPGGGAALAGRFVNALDFGGGPLPLSRFAPNIFIAAIHPGGAHRWSRSYRTDDVQIQTLALASDSGGEVVLGGNFLGTSDFGSGLVTSDSYDIFLVRLGTNGAHEWSKTFTGELFQFLNGVALDADGNVLLAGHFVETVDLGGGPLVNPVPTTSDAFVAKLDAEGTHTWSRQFGDEHEQVASRIAADPQGNVIVGGSFSGSLDFGCAEHVAPTDATHIYLAKLSPDGLCVWSSSFAPDFGSVRDIAVDPQGNVAVGGNVTGDVDFGGGNWPGTGEQTDAFIAQFGSDGTFLWGRRIGDASGTGTSVSIAALPIGDILLGGFFAGTVDFGDGPVGSVGEEDMFSVRYFGGWSAPDEDEDRIGDGSDNCPVVVNPGQENADRNFIDLPTKPFDDHTRANSDAVGDACDNDDDNDGRTDADELAGTGCSAALTDPLDEDTDNDRALDGAECAIGTNPTNAASFPSAAQCGSTTDVDGDGVHAFREVCYYNTDPTVANTDGDLCNDGKEVASVNVDATVNVLDLSALATSFGASPGPPYIVQFDVTKDGVINVLDLSFVAGRFGPC